MSTTAFAPGLCRHLPVSLVPCPPRACACACARVYLHMRVCARACLRVLGRPFSLEHHARSFSPMICPPPDHCLSPSPFLFLPCGWVASGPPLRFRRPQGRPSAAGGPFSCLVDGLQCLPSAAQAHPPLLNLNSWPSRGHNLTPPPPIFCCPLCRHRVLCSPVSTPHPYPPFRRRSPSRPCTPGPPSGPTPVHALLSAPAGPPCLPPSFPAPCPPVAGRVRAVPTLPADRPGPHAVPLPSTGSAPPPCVSFMFV